LGADGDLMILNFKVPLGLTLFYFSLAIQINELPRLIRTAPMDVLMLIDFFSNIIDVKLVISSVREFVKMTATDKTLDLRCRA
jgi:hypothetical protein